MTRTNTNIETDGTVGNQDLNGDQEVKTVHIKLYGSKGDRFQVIKSNLNDQWGFEPSNPEVLGHLMVKYGANSLRQGGRVQSLVSVDAR